MRAARAWIWDTAEAKSVLILATATLQLADERMEAMARILNSVGHAPGVFARCLPGCPRCAWDKLYKEEM